MKATIANDDFAPDNLAQYDAAPACAKCERRGLQTARIETAIWRETGLVVIRNIPALVCPSCGEEFVAGQTARSLDRMCDLGFGIRPAADRMHIPVFDFIEADQGTD